MSGHAEQAGQAPRLGEAPCPFLAKPFRVASLARALRGVLDDPLANKCSWS